MTATDLLRELRRRGIDLWVSHAGRPQIAPASRLTPEDWAHLTTLRDELLPLLPRELTGDQQAALDAYRPDFGQDGWQLLDVVVVDLDGRRVVAPAAEFHDLLAVLAEYHDRIRRRKEQEQARRQERHATKTKRQQKAMDEARGGLFDGGPA